MKQQYHDDNFFAALKPHLYLDNYLKKKPTVEYRNTLQHNTNTTVIVNYLISHVAI